jgi:hypothetical protein
MLRQNPRQKHVWLVAWLLAACAWLLPAWADESVRYRDINLTEERVCKACLWKLLPNGQVRLTNRQGESSVVKGKEIIGVDTHPWARKLMVKGLHGTGLAGKAIVPFAFEDGRDFVCKYCD